MKQAVFIEKKINEILPEVLSNRAISKLMIVCDSFCRGLKIAEDVAGLSIDIVWFQDFSPNPDYEAVVKGIKEFKENSCDAILAIGGGSAMDVAKCVKLFVTMDDTTNYLKQEPVDNGIPLMAIPTTAGTGSEATRYAVIYYCGEKQSVTHQSIIPEYVFLNSEVLGGLPIYQKKVTAMDALCHAIESFWSVNSTEESKAYSREAISLIRENIFSYLSGDMEAACKMFLAANVAGKAINITQTTAGHAMCYKITSLYKLPHGHAAALCVERLWPYMLEHSERCLDNRGVTYLQGIFDELAEAFECENAKEATDKFSELLRELELFAPKPENDNQIEELVKSVNLTRLKNNPVLLDECTLKNLYIEILRG